MVGKCESLLKENRTRCGARYVWIRQAENLDQDCIGRVGVKLYSSVDKDKRRGEKGNNITNAIVKKKIRSLAKYNTRTCEI